MISLTNKQQGSYEKTNIQYVCKRHIAYVIQNIVYLEIYVKITVDSHNGLKYDFYFIIKQLAKELSMPWFKTAVNTMAWAMK